MEAIVELSWRIYPAYALLATGAALAAYGLTVQYRGIVKPIRDPDKNLTWMRGFRLTVVGQRGRGRACSCWYWRC
jgi:hypothetical protein